MGSVSGSGARNRGSGSPCPHRLWSSSGQGRGGVGDRRGTLSTLVDRHGVEVVKPCKNPCRRLLRSTLTGVRTLCVGEALGDLVCERPVASISEADSFTPRFGGAIANV